MKKNIAIVAAYIIICIIFYCAAPAITQKNTGEWYSILPPLTAVALAFLTQRLILSLSVAILLGGLLFKVIPAPLEFMSWVGGIGAGFGHFFASISDKTNFQIIVFAIGVLVMISVMSASGGIRGLALSIAKWADTRKSTKILTALMGLVIFIDDYANTMIIGSTMRPVSDRMKVSREKLAFLVDATSAPVAGIAVVSTWIGYEVGLFADIAKTLNFNTTGYAMFFDGLNYRFYCFLMLAFVFIQVFIDVDFGPMKKAEERALKAPDAENQENLDLAAESAKLHKSTALLPLGTLIGVLFVSLWLDGGGAEKMASASSFFSLSYWRNVIGSAENSVFILAYCAILGIVVASLSAFAISKTPVNIIGKAMWEGCKKGLVPTLILVFAWSLKGVLGDLKTGAFLAVLLKDLISPEYFPVLLFLLAGFMGFSTGTSWGTMAILIPTAIPLAYQLDGSMYGLITMISLGAILDGAIMGDHCSPISDTTILSSMATDCPVVDHVRTQLPYSLLVGSVAMLCGYLPSAMGINSWIGMLLGVVLLAAILFGVKQFQTKAVA